MTSQTIWGRVDMNVYVTGRDLLNIGVTPLEDMISETALVKLMWVLGQTRSPEKIRELMLQIVAGEITERTPIMRPHNRLSNIQLLDLESALRFTGSLTPTVSCFVIVQPFFLSR